MIHLITLNLNELFVPVLLAIIGSYATFKISIKPEKQKTSRLLYDKSFQPIFSYVEKYLYSKIITLREVHELANQILIILTDSKGYYHPSVKDYALKMKRSNEDNYLEHWTYFSVRFSYRYDKLSKDIGVPLRGSAYRLNQRQYKDWWELTKLFFKLFWPTAIVLIIYIYLIYIAKSFLS